MRVMKASVCDIVEIAASEYEKGGPAFRWRGFGIHNVDMKVCGTNVAQPPIKVSAKNTCLVTFSKCCLCNCYGNSEIKG